MITSCAPPMVVNSDATQIKQTLDAKLHHEMGSRGGPGSCPRGKEKRPLEGQELGRLGSWASQSLHRPR